MVPSFHKQVEPQVPGGLKDLYYLIPYVHAIMGTIAEVLGIYIVLVAGTKLVPKKLRFRRYKPWMRTALALWWVVVLLGVWTYYAWYVGPAPKSEPVTATAPAQMAAEKVSVKISNFQFEPKELTVKAGTIVEWTDERGRHTVEADDGSFKSEALTAGGQFEHKFDTPGVYPYYCTFHGDKHGVDMAGVITVTGRGQ
jgi:plastocyanin